MWFLLALWPYYVLAGLVCTLIWLFSLRAERDDRRLDTRRRINVLLGWDGLSAHERANFSGMRIMLEDGHRLGSKEVEWVAAVWRRYLR